MTTSARTGTQVWKEFRTSPSPTDLQEPSHHRILPILPSVTQPSIGAAEGSGHTTTTSTEVSQPHHITSSSSSTLRRIVATTDGGGATPPNGGSATSSLTNNSTVVLRDAPTSPTRPPRRATIVLNQTKDHGGAPSDAPPRQRGVASNNTGGATNEPPLEGRASSNCSPQTSDTQMGTVRRNSQRLVNATQLSPKPTLAAAPAAMPQRSWSQTGEGRQQHGAGHPPVSPSTTICSSQPIADPLALPEPPSPSSYGKAAISSSHPTDPAPVPGVTPLPLPQFHDDALAASDHTDTTGSGQTSMVGRRGGGGGGTAAGNVDSASGGGAIGNANAAGGSGRPESSMSGFHHHLFARNSCVSLTTMPPVTESTRAILQEADPIDGCAMINQYLVMASIGQGSQATVHLVFDTENSEMRAMKSIRRSRAAAGITGLRTHKARIMQLGREIQIMKRCRHRNIVALHEVIDDPDSDSLYLVMQYVPNGALFTVNARGIASRTFTAPEVAGIVRQVCASVVYLHERGLVHRDIKPDNLLVDASNGTVYLADFGVSDILNPLMTHSAPTSEPLSASLATSGAPSQPILATSISPSGNAVGGAAPPDTVTYPSSAAIGHHHQHHAVDDAASGSMMLLSGNDDQSQNGRGGGMGEDGNYSMTSIPTPDHRSTHRGSVSSRIAFAHHGTRAFQPPELLSSATGLVENGKAADVWALGVTFYVMLTGRLPWPVSVAEDFAVVVCSMDVADMLNQPDASAMPAVWKHIITGCLTRDVSLRWTVQRVRRAVRMLDEDYKRKQREAEDLADELMNGSGENGGESPNDRPYSASHVAIDMSPGVTSPSMTEAQKAPSYVLP